MNLTAIRLGRAGESLQAPGQESGRYRATPEILRTQVCVS